MLSPVQHNFVSYAGASLAFALSLPPGAAATSVHALMWHAHFIRRALETAFLFRFGSARVIPPEDSAVEFAYYWLFAFFIARGSPDFGSGGAHTALGLAVWAAAECANCKCHAALASVPKKSVVGARQRVDGRHGPLFGSVSCPHYFFEMLSWLGFCAATGFNACALVFMLAGGLIMTCYAVARHESYGPSAAHTPVFPFGIDVRPPRSVVDAIAA